MAVSKQQANADAIAAMQASLADLVLRVTSGAPAPPATPQPPITVPPALLAMIPPGPNPTPPVVTQPIHSAPTPALPPIIPFPAAIPGMHMLQTQVPTAPPAPVINRSEAGGQSRASNCACCGQRLRKGTVIIATGEYVPSGMTTKWLELQQDLPVIVQGAHHKVSGQWLSNELKQRARGQRATSVPGFLCLETNSVHPTVSLQQPILRRATQDEEKVQYASRVLKEAIKLQNEGHRA